MNKIYIIVISLIVIFLTSCEDSAIQDYKPEAIVEAYLIVDKPISEIRILNSQPLFQKYDENNYLIKNANIVIYSDSDNQSFPLQYNYKEQNGYYYPDTTYLVKPNNKYSIEIKLENGQVITGNTVTPGRIEMITDMPKILQFPFDTLNQKSTDSIAWNPVPNINYYTINIMCLDTLNYGKYLSPATNELNRRTYVLLNRGAEHSDRKTTEISFSTLMPSNSTPVVWNAFRWFGKHFVSIYAIDINMVQWSMFSYYFPMHDNRLSSVKGGKGCFGSASVVSDTVFILKNQP